MSGIVAIPITEAFDLDIYLSPAEDAFEAINMFLGNDFM